MTETKILKELSNLIGDFVESIIKSSGIPTVKSCIVKSTDGNGLATVSCNGSLYQVRCRNNYTPGDIVEVMLPNGTWNRAFIVY